MLLRKVSFEVLFLLWLVSSEVKGAITQGPSNVTYFPGQPDIVLTCAVSAGVPVWIVNGSTFTINQLDNDMLLGHRSSGTNIVIEAPPANDTMYVCEVSPVLNTTFVSDPAFVYVASRPDMIGSIIIDFDTVNVDNNNVSFTLNWTKPFANFDPIVNYTITINCTDTNTTLCPVFTVTTTSASVYFITDLSMMTPVSVTASNTVGESDPATIVISVPDGVDMVDIMCGPVDVINQCIVTWNVLPNNSVASIYYDVSYYGENITSGSVSVDVPMATIDLPAVDSDVNVTVTAMNVFGSGPASNVSMDEIMASSLITTKSVFDFDPDDLMNTYSLVVTCEINPTSSAEYCEVIARNDDTTISNSASITSDMVTVTLSLLECEEIYTIAAGGVDSATELVGPRIVSETVTASACPVPPTTSSVPVVDTSTVMAPTSTMSTTPVPPDTSAADDDDNTGVIVGVVVGVVVFLIIVFLVVLILLWCYCKNKREKSSRATSPAGGGTGVKVHTLDRYGKPIIEGDDADTGVELKGYTAKSPEFTVQTSAGPTSTFQGNDYQNEDKNRTPSTFVPEGSYDTLAPADEPNVPSAEVVPPAQNGQSAPGAPKLNYAELEQFTRKPEAVKKQEAQPPSQYAVIDPKSLQGTYT